MNMLLGLILMTAAQDELAEKVDAALTKLRASLEAFEKQIGAAEEMADPRKRIEALTRAREARVTADDALQNASLLMRESASHDMHGEWDARFQVLRRRLESARCLSEPFQDADAREIANWGALRTLVSRWQKEIDDAHREIQLNPDDWKKGVMASYPAYGLAGFGAPEGSYGISSDKHVALMTVEPYRALRDAIRHFRDHIRRMYPSDKITDREMQYTQYLSRLMECFRRDKARIREAHAMLFEVVAQRMAIDWALSRETDPARKAAGAPRSDQAMKLDHALSERIKAAWNVEVREYRSVVRLAGGRTIDGQVTTLDGRIRVQFFEDGHKVEMFDSAAVQQIEDRWAAASDARVTSWDAELRNVRATIESLKK